MIHRQTDRQTGSLSLTLQMHWGCCTMCQPMYYHPQGMCAQISSVMSGKFAIKWVTFLIDALSFVHFCKELYDDFSTIIIINSISLNSWLLTTIKSKTKLQKVTKKSEKTKAKTTEEDEDEEAYLQYEKLTPSWAGSLGSRTTAVPSATLTLSLLRDRETIKS